MKLSQESNTLRGCVDQPRQISDAPERRASWMTPGCIVTVELAHNEDLLPPPGFEVIDERRHGAAKIVILKRKS